MESLNIFQGYQLQMAKAAIYILAFSFTAFTQTVFGELLPKQYTLVRAESVLMVLIWPCAAGVG